MENMNIGVKIENMEDVLEAADCRRILAVLDIAARAVGHDLFSSRSRMLWSAVLAGATSL